MVEPQHIEGFFGGRFTCDSPATQFERWAVASEVIPSGMNKEGREKDTDARRWRRCIDDPRRGIINSFPVAIAIRPINTLVTAVVVFSPTFMVIFANGRRHVYTADHCGQDKPHHNLAHDGSEIPCT